MTIKSAIWIPPSLCGCKFQMKADFTDNSVVDGVSYRHPKPFTITSLEIISVCDAHQPQMATLPDISGLMEIDSYTGQSYQARGYLKFSEISVPTLAQCLYAFLSQFGGQAHGYPCGCQGHQFIDQKKNINYIEHPLHTRKCHKHFDDSVDMQKATQDFKAQIMDSQIITG